MRAAPVLLVLIACGCSSSSHLVDDAGVDAPARDFGPDAPARDLGRDAPIDGAVDDGARCEFFMDFIGPGGCFGHGYCTGDGGEWVCICADAGAPDAAGLVDASADLGAPTVDDGGVLQVMLAEVLINSCLCHHGCGAGIDGGFNLFVGNGDTVAHVVEITSITLTAIGSPAGPFTAPGDGYFTGLDAPTTIGPLVGNWFPITVYIDFSSPPFVAMPGTYRIDLVLDVDGAPRTVTLDSVSVGLGSGCPP